MKLVVAIVQDEDVDALTEELIGAGHRFTRSARRDHSCAPAIPVC